MQNKFSFKTLNDIEGVVGKLAGKRVLLRLDLNVPIKRGEVFDGFRIKQSLDTIDFLRDAGAKIIVVAHLENKLFPSLEIVCKYAEQFFPAVFVKDPWSIEGGKTLSGLSNSQVAIIENIRNWEGEKANDEAFAKKLSELADLYVNEAFSVSHREHSSIVGVPKFLPSFAGFNFVKEVEHLSMAFNPTHPYLFVLGGAKFETKMPLVKKFLDIADNVFIGGALANDLYKTKGYEIGKSVCSDKDFGFAEIVANNKLILPMDIVVSDEAHKKIIKRADQVLVSENIADAGKQAVVDLEPVIKNAKFILWNGPLGVFETGYTDGTFALAHAIATSTANGTKTIVGGGDTLASIEKLNLGEKFTFISTAGGAMLDFLANETLPGIEALNK